MQYLPEVDCDIPQVDLLTLIYDSDFAWAKDDTVVYAEAENETNCITKAQAAALTKRLVYVLRTNFGVGAPERPVVTCISSNQVLLPVIFYAVIGAGGIYSAASTASTPLELTRQIQQGGSSLIIASDETAKTALNAAQRCGIPPEKVLILRSMGHERLLIPAVSPGEQKNYLDETRELPWEKITDPERLKQTTIALLYSSGTTGLPKGVQLSHRNLVAEAILTQAGIGMYLTRTGRQVHVDFAYRTIGHLPSAHISGLQGYFINGVMAGGTVFWMPKYNFEDFVRAAGRHRITFLLSVPAVYLRIVKSSAITDEFSTLVHAQSGAAPMGPELQVAAQRKLKCNFSQAWGLTETTGVFTSLPWDRSDTTGSISQLLPNTRMKIVDDQGDPVAEGQLGEILVRGPNVTIGYHNNPQATSEAFTPDGWFRTGDIGLRRDGMFYVVDRKKDLIKYKGLQVSPVEIEGMLIGHPNILDAAVVGIPDPNIPGNEIPRAFVVRRPGASEIGAKEVMDLVTANLAAHKQLRGGVEFIDQIPRNPSGKILRRKLVNRASLKHQERL